MSVQVVRYTSRGVDITLNFASTENNLSWSFTQEGDGEIYDVSFTNVASYTLAGGSIALPYAVTNGSSYAVSIVKTTAGQTASITFKTRRATNKTSSLSIPDLSDLSIASNYILLTNVGNNGQVIVTQNSEIEVSNYQGGGVFTNTIIRGVVNLPDISTAFGTPAFSWVIAIHSKYNNSDYVVVVGHATANNLNRQRVVCLINPSTLAVTNLDGAANSYTIINAPANSDSAQQQIPQCYSEDFINGKILFVYSGSICELDITSRTFVTNGFPFPSFTQGLSQTKRELYYNPIDQNYIALYGQFNKMRASTFSSFNNLGCYDYLRNVKIGTANYWGRMQGYDKNGLLTWAVDNTTYTAAAILIKPKKDLLFLINNSYCGFQLQNSPYTSNYTLITDKNFTSVVDSCYANADGNKWITITNGVRIVICWINRVGNITTQAYYDLPAIPLSICSDKILISA